MLDYAFEVAHFDRHLGRMLATLEKRGLLDNTVVVVTSDHGMPFPRVKGNTYSFANRVPMAVLWKGGIVNPGRVADDFVSFVDLAPTFVELAGLKWAETGMAESAGRSLLPVFRSGKCGVTDPSRDHAVVGRERTDVGRPGDAGYPVRGLARAGWLYLKNFEPSRWPAGNPETGYLDCDGGATKTVVLEARRKNPSDPFWQFCFGYRPAEELYDLQADPDCLRNLAGGAGASRAAAMREALFGELRGQGDPRLAGEGAVFDQYPYAGPAQARFHERFVSGEPVRAGWVNESDFERGFPAASSSTTNASARP